MVKSVSGDDKNGIGTKIIGRKQTARGIGTLEKTFADDAGEMART